MPMKLARFRVLLCIVGTMLMAVEVGHACTCMAPATAAEAFHKSSTVFRGKVTRIYRSFLDTAGITQTGNHRASLKTRNAGRVPNRKAPLSLTDSAERRVGFRLSKRRSIWSTWPPDQERSRRVFVQGQKVLLARSRKWSSWIKSQRRVCIEAIAGRQPVANKRA
jgi:hypothetical protein